MELLTYCLETCFERGTNYWIYAPILKRCSQILKLGLLTTRNTFSIFNILLMAATWVSQCCVKEWQNSQLILIHNGLVGAKNQWDCMCSGPHTSSFGEWERKRWHISTPFPTSAFLFSQNSVWGHPCFSRLLCLLLPQMEHSIQEESIPYSPRTWTPSYLSSSNLAFDSEWKRKWQKCIPTPLYYGDLGENFAFFVESLGMP